MKKLPSLLLASSVFAAFAFAADMAKKDAPAAAKEPAIPATAATVSKPMAVKDGVLSQPEKSEIADGGKAVFDVTVPKEGNYVIYAVVDAADDDNNSFYVNVDAKPEDPLMIWDIEITNGFEERVVNWRGSGEAGSDEFDPKVFKLSAGAHKINFWGREPAKLKSISVRPAPAAMAAPAAKK